MAVVGFVKRTPSAALPRSIVMLEQMAGMFYIAMVATRLGLHATGNRV